MHVRYGCLSTLILWNKVIDVTHRRLVPGATPTRPPHARSRALFQCLYVFIFNGGYIKENDGMVVGAFTDKIGY